MSKDIASINFEQLSDAQLAEILKRFDRTPTTFAEDVDVIIEWLKMQPHLPQNVLTRNMVSTTLLLNKCSVEKSKQKIDSKFTMHSMFPEYFKNVQPWQKNMLDVKKLLYVVAIPKLTEKNERIFIASYKQNDITDFNMISLTSFIGNAAILTYLDDNVGEFVFVWDMKHFKFDYVKSVNPVILRKSYLIFEKAFHIKNNGIHFINTAGFVLTFVNILKSLLKPKLRERFFVHEDMDSFYKAVPKSHLPKDYDGDQPTLDKLEEHFSQRFDKYRDFFEKRNEWVVNEDLRSQKLEDNELLGIQGNFKKLNFD